MYNYMKDSDFLESVHNEDFKAIKSIIVTRVIKAYNWNKEKIDEVIIYANKNGNFNFEEHIDYDRSGIEIGTREEYNFEIGRLNDNFSKERYLKILKMAKELNLIRKEEAEIKEKIDDEKQKDKKSYKTSDSKKNKVEKEKKSGEVKSYLKEKKYNPKERDYVKKKYWSVIVGIIVIAIIYLVIKVMEN